jgi:hypothetical protein
MLAKKKFTSTLLFSGVKVALLRCKPLAFAKQPSSTTAPMGEGVDWDVARAAQISLLMLFRSYP